MIFILTLTRLFLQVSISLAHRELKMAGLVSTLHIALWLSRPCQAMPETLLNGESRATILAKNSWDTWAISIITYPPCPLINVEIYHVFSYKKGKKYLINIESRGRGELASCPNSLVWDCRSLDQQKLVHNTPGHYITPCIVTGCQQNSLAKKEVIAHWILAPINQ